MANLQTTTFDDTGFLDLPQGTTAQRPSSPAVGMIRFNTSRDDIEYYNGSQWVGRYGGILTATSTGSVTVVNDGRFKIHAFTGTGTFTVTTAGLAQILVVAGGGGAGRASNDGGGGGGAGGVVYSSQTINAGTYSIEVGSGGSRGIGGAGADGENSTALGLTALGGGGGGAYSGFDGRDGGSGGGERGSGSAIGQALQPASASGGFGNPGGRGGGNDEGGGGGGGAGSVAQDDTSGLFPGAAGGEGLYFGDVFTNLFGESGWFAGGGGSNSGDDGGIGGPGGRGGGGQGGGVSGTDTGQDGLINTGGGGGAGHSGISGNGGSGIVIVSYLR